MTDLKLMPVQVCNGYQINGRVRESVYMAAYEVYARVYGPQEAMVTGGCRGGFAASELIAFLYARAFPRDEWRQRVNEAFVGMGGLSP
jgi:hypothetical protein